MFYIEYVIDEQALLPIKERAQEAIGFDARSSLNPVVRITGGAVKSSAPTARIQRKWCDMVQTNDSLLAVIQNLKDAGCEANQIESFLQELKKGDSKGQLDLLAQHRKILLNRVHKEERRIDCLDYLVYQIRQYKI